jgi:hypothetical protein
MARRRRAEDIWNAAMRAAVEYAKKLDATGVHKHIVNRLTEPYQHIRVVLTATDLDNFFALRDHPDAEPHIQILARRMKEAMDASSTQEADQAGTGIFPTSTRRTIESAWLAAPATAANEPQPAPHLGGPLRPRLLQDVRRQALDVEADLGLFREAGRLRADPRLADRASGDAGLLAGSRRSLAGAAASRQPYRLEAVPQDLRTRTSKQPVPSGRLAA